MRQVDGGRASGGGGRDALSPRESEVMELLAGGLSNREIAESLHIAPSTVKRHLANAYPKLDVHSRLAAALRVRELRRAV